MAEQLATRTNVIDRFGGTILPAVVAFSIALPIRANVLITLSAFLFYFLHALFTRDSRWHFFRSPLFILIAVHLGVQLIGLLYTSNLKQGLQQMERWGFALLLPFLVFLMAKWGVSGSRLIAGFIAGCIAASFYALVHAAAFLTEAERVVVYTQGHTDLADVIRIHPMYLGLFFCFALFFVLELIRTRYAEISSTRKIFYIILVVYIIGFVFLLRSQVILIVLMLMVVLYGLALFRRRAALVTFFLFGVGFVVYMMDARRQSTFFDVYGKNVSTAVDNRLKIWESAGMAIREAPLFGAGTGGEQDALDKGYLQIGYEEGIKNQYNSHNQYMQFLLRNGIVELVVFMILLIYSFRASRSGANYTFLLFNMMVSIVMVIESFLSVQKGIVFFYFFVAVFVYLPLVRRTELTNSGQPVRSTPGPG